MFFACLLTTACSKNDEPAVELTGEWLEATTWDAELTGTQYPIPEPISAHFVIQFLTTDTGKCVPSFGGTEYEGSFTYRITKNMITFNGSLVGNWTVIEQTKTKLIMQSFQPNEMKLVMTKM